MKTVLLTGGNGFVGRHAVSELLNHGYHVHVVTRNPEGIRSSHERMYVHCCDLLDYQQQKVLFEKIRPSHLLHFAWYAVHAKFWASPENIRWVQAGLELLRNLYQFGGYRVVFAGTCAEYDWTYGYCSENITPTSPNTLYGVCKNSLQQILKLYCQETSLSSAWGRIFFLYGPHEHPARLIPSVINSLLNNQQARCTHGLQTRDFMYVEDAASAFVALLDSDVQGAVNIASGQAITLKEIVELIAEKLGSCYLLKLGALTASSNDPPLLLANTIRLNNEVGWRPKFDLNTGIELTIEWWKLSFERAGKPD